MAQSWSNQVGKYRSEVSNLFTLYQSRPDLQAYLEIILSLVTVIVFGLFALRPTARTITALVQENRGKQETVDILNSKIKNLTAASQVYDDQREKIALVDLAIPEEENPNQIIDSLQNSISQNSLVADVLLIDKINIKGTTQTTQYAQNPDGSVVNFSANVPGSFSSFLNLIKTFENSQRQLVIDSASITTESGDINETSPQPILNINGSALFYYTENKTTQ